MNPLVMVKVLDVRDLLGFHECLSVLHRPLRFSYGARHSKERVRRVVALIAVLNEISQLDANRVRRLVLEDRPDGAVWCVPELIGVYRNNPVSSSRTCHPGELCQKGILMKGSSIRLPLDQ